ncbi:MAG TPA: hypothetical protein VF857_05395 [Spirochaetota bacterium]
MYLTLRLFRALVIRLVQSVIAVCGFLFCMMIAACTSIPRMNADDMICKEHGTHRITVKTEFAACFGVDPKTIDEYYLFSKEETVPKDKINATSVRLKNAVADEIVDEILKRLEAAFGNDVNANWHLESIDMPVPFRTFVRTRDGDVDLKVVGIVRKKNLEPGELIHFLPLEYKMKLLKPNRKDIQDLGNP